ncbi:hypothetical protein N1851_003928 [Merluccius polli]|uniref:Integrase core domain-containing protein n=1 Tax=Merluccius polli TaxID=89951 RepID=A0AA47N8X0_MERPO|nr:hypothetical protein N1851_003928 [Merluccius polli]
MADMISHIADMISYMADMSMITNYNYNKEAHIVTHMYAKGERGRPKIMLSQQYASRLLEIGLSVPCIGKPLAVSVKTLFRRMGKWGLSVRELYSTLGDDELDSLLSEMHTVNPNAGYRMVMAILGAKGHRVQWDRVMYLGTAKNNWASTTLAFFNEAGERYGFPQRIERLWKDIWTAVTKLYYDVLHHLKEERHLDLSSGLHIFCYHFIFLPHKPTGHLQRWHPLSTEGNLTPI